MPLDATQARASERAAALTKQFAGAHPQHVLHGILNDPPFARVALAGSFTSEAVVLLHMTAQIAPMTPVLLPDTGLLAPEALDHQRRLSATLGLKDVRTLRPERTALFARDPDGILHVMDPDASCRLRCVEPLNKALEDFDAWISPEGPGKSKRPQGTERPQFEAVQGRMVVRPLAQWSARDIAMYLHRHELTPPPNADLYWGLLPGDAGGSAASCNEMRWVS